MCIRDRNRPEPAERLIAAGANVNARDNQGVTPLHCASAAWSSETVDRLLAAGADPQAQDQDRQRTPLHHAVERNHLEVVNRLLESGMDPNARDSGEETLLHEAARRGSPRMVERLLAAGADPQARDNQGRTALHWASGLNARETRNMVWTKDRVATVEHLIQAGAPVNARDDNGRTALHESAEMGSPETARRLLEAGANMNARDGQGKTPVEYGTQLEPGADEFRKVFEEHQARLELQGQPPEAISEEKDQQHGQAAVKSQPSQQREQQTLEQAAPPKRRWWRRGKPPAREGAKDKAQRSAKPSAREFAEKAAERVIQQLEKGVAPWQKGWDKPTAAAAPPYNPATGNRYKGLNTVVLRAEAEERGYSDPRWVTYKGAKEMDAHVRKGERGTKIEYWKFPPKEQIKDKEAAAGEEPEKPRIIHRTYTVFNAEQCDGMPQLKHTQPQRDWEVSERAERLLQESGAKIEHQHGDSAYYRVSEDKIVLPKQEQFRSDEAYYSTALHEMGHWTGHKDRLDRETLHQGIEQGFGSEAYAKEELRAEMTSMTVNGEMKLPHDPERHAAYVKSWIKTLKDDPNELRRAARDAGEAAEYLLQYDRERSREVAGASREAVGSSPTQERSQSVEKEPQRQVERGREVSLGR